MPGSLRVLRDRPQLHKQSTAPDGGGGSIVTWITIATVWGRVKPFSANDQVKDKAVELQQVTKVTLRWRSDLGTYDTNHYRLLWNGNIMRINGISNPDERRRFLELTCEMGQAVAA